MIDTLTLSREVTKVGIPVRARGCHRRLRHLHPCRDAGGTDHHRVGGSGAPGTPPPIGNGRAITQSILFRLLIVCTAAIGAEVGRPGPPAGRDWLEPGQTCY